jgi:hypothetical protein
MTKRILITAGPVYGKLDDNKLVSNRSRGLWATEFAKWLLRHEHRDEYQPILLVPDIMEFGKQLDGGLRDGLRGQIEIRIHSGYDDYRRLCHELAPEVDAAIMAAAVVNWIPETPFPGKMPTDGPDRQLVPFILAPRVINEMKALNPTLTLIGCKLLFSADYDQLIDAAYHVILNARCNAVIANDARLGLKRKFVVHQDRTVALFHEDFEGFYNHLHKLIDDVHYRTQEIEEPLDLKPEHHRGYVQAGNRFDHLCELFRSAFVPRLDGVPTDNAFVFGAVAVRTPDGRYLVSPREKGSMFSSKDAVLVDSVVDRVVYTQEGKASLNAPLLIRHLDAYPNAYGVVHYHGDWDGWEKLGCLGVSAQAEPVVDYAPPGTVRDNGRAIPGPSYKITGHGWIIAVDRNGKPL